MCYIMIVASLVEEGVIRDHKAMTHNPTDDCL